MLLNGVTAQGQARLVLGDEAERVKDADGKPGYRLTDEGIRLGLTHLEWQAAVYNDRGLHGLLRRWVYRDGDLGSYAARPFYGSLALFALGLFVAVPKDRARRMILKHGRHLKGSELVTAAEFNTKLGRSKRLMLYLPDGVAFANEKMGWSDRLFNKNSSGWARIPREREGMHFVLAGDSGGGKAAAIRQILAEARARGEAAVVYDPAMEYLARYYNSRTGTFCSADPLAGSPGDPQSWNRYPYGRNDPIDITDPSGKSWWSKLLIDVGIGVAAYFAPEALSAIFGEASGGTAVGSIFTALPGTTSPITLGADGIYTMSATAPAIMSATLSTMSAGTELALTAGTMATMANLPPSTPTPTPTQTPKKNCPPKYANFFKQAPIFNALATKLKTSALFLMAQSSWETGWLGPHAQSLNMLFGMTHAGKNDLSYSSFQASANSYYTAYSPYVSNTSTMDQFTAGLKSIPSKSGNGYNADPGYYKSITDQQQWVKQHAADCGVTIK